VILGVAIVFTGVVEVRDIRVIGVPDALAQRAHDAARQWLDERVLFVRRGAVLPAVRAARLTDALAARLPELASISVALDAPHTLAIAARERIPDGVWCRQSAEESRAACRFWDASGVFWGSTVPSIGPLLLLVRDERSEPDAEDLFVGVLAAVRGLEPLGIRARYVVLPDAEPGGVRIPTDRGWDLYLDASGDVADQLGTLAVFLADKAKNLPFNPAYIDLRTPGRVYFR
jgi:hypothetical protein